MGKMQSFVVKTIIIDIRDGMSLICPSQVFISVGSKLHITITVGERQGLNGTLITGVRKGSPVLDVTIIFINTHNARAAAVRPFGTIITADSFAA